MTKTNEAPGEDSPIRCRKLGHEVPFSYCRYENRGLPCSKTIDCWYDHFLIEDFLRRELNSEDWIRTFLKPPEPKVLTLVDLIKKARES